MDRDYSQVRIFTLKQKNDMRNLTAKAYKLVDLDNDLSQLMMELDGKQWRVAYREDEAKLVNLSYVHWRDTDPAHMEYPCYVQYECGWIALTIDWFSTPMTLNLVTALGHRILSSKSTRAGNIKPYFDIMKRPITLQKAYGANVYTKKALVAGLMACNCNLDQIAQYFKYLPGTNQRRKIKTYMAKKEVIKMATEEVKQALGELGITPEYIINQMKEALEYAKKTKNAKALVEGVKEMANWTGFNDKDTKTKTQAIELIDYHKDLATLETETKKVKLIETKEVDNNG